MFVRKKLNSKGDTIVEVLISVAVLGLILAVSYSIASKGLRISRQAQEHAEALKIAEGQLERLKARAATNPDVFSQPGGFCMASDTAPQSITPPSPTATLPDNFGNYNNCKFTLKGQPCTIGYCYNAGIRKGSGSNANTFTVTIRWDSIGDSEQDEVKISYRLYQ